MQIYTFLFYLCKARATQIKIDIIMKNKIIQSFLSPADVQKMFSITRPTEIQWRKDGKLPKPLNMGRRVYYRVTDLQELQCK